ncbi:Hypp8104 [Branchiostoma lanceolatum]|uniref:Hypp8104 protein n=1 Tax=Branchiostoma lanceolatum TaxID=7740 RepID=A0A8J9Z707_BRALA|nr:Hypp8104 [Branchiostoma lanceolatum]
MGSGSSKKASEDRPQGGVKGHVQNGNTRKTIPPEHGREEGKERGGDKRQKRESLSVANENTGRKSPYWQTESDFSMARTVDAEVNILTGELDEALRDSRQYTGGRQPANARRKPHAGDSNDYLTSNTLAVKNNRNADRREKSLTPEGRTRISPRVGKDPEGTGDDSGVENYSPEVDNDIEDTLAPSYQKQFIFDTENTTTTTTTTENNNTSDTGLYSKQRLAPPSPDGHRSSNDTSPDYIEAPVEYNESEEDLMKEIESNF